MERRTAVTAVLALLSGAAWAGSYPECLLKGLPGSQNATVTNAVVRECLAKYPEGYFGLDRGYAQRNEWFPSTRDECVKKHGANTSDARAALLIQGACVCKYEPASFFQQPCP